MAESLYWIGRYVERAEQTARITDVTFSHTLTMGSTAEAEARRARHWAALLDIVGERATFADDGEPVDEDTVPTLRARLQQTEQEIRALGVECTPVKCDLTVRKDVVLEPLPP